MERELALLNAVARALALDPAAVSVQDSFLDLGGDSLAALYISEELALSGYQIDPISLFENESLHHVALGMRRTSVAQGE
jgi:hypothetical protein